MPPQTDADKIRSAVQQDLLETPARIRFLESLKSQGKYQYKRYRGLPIRYAGGKSLGVGYVFELHKKRRIAQPFF